MGIGKGIAHRLAEAGAQVVIADLDEEVAGATAQEFSDAGWSAAPYKCDVSQEESIQALAGFVQESYGQLDILVNNAGIFPIQSVQDMSLETYDSIMGINMRGVFMTTKIFGAMMIERGEGGKIINISSIDALHPSAVGLAAYDASKHGVWGFTKNTALEYAAHGIQVNAIAPGSITTPGTGAGQEQSEEMKAIAAKMVEKIPMKRNGEPDDIGTVALFLASDMSRYMTGSQVVVDGGVLLS